MNVQWNKYFDHIFCITYVNNGKYEGIKNELKRVGILDSGIFEFIYDVDYKYKDVMINALPADWIAHQYLKASTMNHYMIWKISKELKYERVLILEDDIGFLKDLNQINDLLGHTEFGDITLFDYNLPNGAFSDEIFYSAASYSLNQKGLDVIIYNFENNAFCVADQLLMSTNINVITHTSYNENLNLGYKQNIYNYYVNNIDKYTFKYSDYQMCVQCLTKYNVTDKVPQIKEPDKNMYNIWLHD